MGYWDVYTVDIC